VAALRHHSRVTIAAGKRQGRGHGRDERNGHGGGGDEVPEWLGDLSDAEQILWDRFPYGVTVDYSSGDSEIDDPARAAEWGPERTIRAEVVCALLLGARAPIPGRTAGVRVTGARIVGQSELRHGRIEVPLTLRRCWIEDTLRLDESIAMSIDLSGSHVGRILAEGARIRGSLKLDDTTVSGDPAFALRLDEITVDTDLSAKRMTCLGPVRLNGANIGAILDMTGSTLSQPGDVALNLGSARIGRAMLLSDARLKGQLRLPGAYCGGLALLSRTHITEVAGTAIEAEGFEVSGDGYFQHGFQADGGVVLVGAKFGGILSFRGSKLHSDAHNPALHCGGMQVSRGLYLNHGFRSVGEVRLIGVQIGGHLDLVGIAEDCGPLTLYHASVATIRDGKVENWPSEVLIDGLTYNAFDPYLPGKDRLELLRRQRGGYRAQPYEFMAAYYRALGHEEDARVVLMEKERVRRAEGRPWDRFVGVIFGTLVGYGYRPARALLFSVLIQIAASAFFASWRPTQVRPEDHVVYYPALYAADLFVPIVHFGQADAFQSHGFAAVVAMVLPYLGWILGIAIVAGASRALTRGAAVAG
jgi:hypothetical protein